MQCVWPRASPLARRVVREHGEGAQWTAKQEISRKKKKKSTSKSSQHEGHSDVVHVAKSESIGEEGGEELK